MVTVPVPRLKAGGVLVRTKVSAVSIGTERLMIETARKSLLGKAMARPDLVRRALEKAGKEGFLSVWREAMNRLDEPVPLGYSSCGEVIGVGEGVSHLSAGDRVACMGAGFAGHGEVVWVPERLCAKIPEGVDWDEAAFGMVGGIALHGVNNARIVPGDRVAVIGLGLLGLLTVQMVKARGAQAIGVDVDPAKVALAKGLGAHHAFLNSIQEEVENLTRGRGADRVIVTASSNDTGPMDLAAQIARARGRIVLVGVCALTLDRKAFWEKELELTVSKAAGPGSLGENAGENGARQLLEEYLMLVASKEIQMKPLITHRFRFDEALKAYAGLISGRDRYIGVVFEYADGGSTGCDRDSTVQVTPMSSSARAVRTVGVIGGGPFAKNVLLPQLKLAKGVRLKTIATTNGVGSQHLAKKFGFEYATSRHEEVMDDPEIDSVMILTRHHQHAPLVLEALEKKRNIYVEKPLAICEEELLAIAEKMSGLNGKAPRLAVGFNRSASPLVARAKASLKGRTSPLVMTYRINAGFIPLEHWVHDPAEGGGRVIGEVCHYLELMAHLADSDPVSVYAKGVPARGGKYSSDDNVVITVAFGDGSLGTILYTAQGSKAFSRERLEIFCGDCVAAIEDFRSLTWVQGGRRRQTRLMAQELGFREELEQFFKPGRACARDLNRALRVSLASIRARESLEAGVPLDVEPLCGVEP